MEGRYQILSFSVPLLAILLSFLSARKTLPLAISIFYGFVVLFLFSPNTVSVVNVLNDVFLYIDKIKIVLAILLFSLLVGSMNYLGFTSTLIDFTNTYIQNRKSAQLITVLNSVIFFFDEFTHSFAVKNATKSITDRHRISREKLNFIIVNSASPIAIIILLASWINSELNEISNAINQPITGVKFNYFAHALKYSYYPIFIFGFVCISIFTGREFGSMKHAKPVISSVFNHYSSKKIEAKRVIRAFSPLCVFVLVYGCAFFLSGYIKQTSNSWNLNDIISEAHSIDALLTGSFITVFWFLVYTRKKMDYGYFESLKVSLYRGSRTILLLLLAWALGYVIKKLNVPLLVVQNFSYGLSPYALPALFFLMSGLVSYLTKSKYISLSILFPVLLPIVLVVCKDTNVNLGLCNDVLFHSIASIVSGALLGNHFVNSFENKILNPSSSSKSESLNIRSQKPYSFVVAGVSLFFSLTLANMGLPWFIVYFFGFLTLYLIIRIYGRTY